MKNSGLFINTAKNFTSEEETEENSEGFKGKNHKKKHDLEIEKLCTTRLQVKFN